MRPPVASSCLVVTLFKMDIDEIDVFCPLCVEPLYGDDPSSSVGVLPCLHTICTACVSRLAAAPSGKLCLATVGPNGVYCHAPFTSVDVVLVVSPPSSTAAPAPAPADSSESIEALQRIEAQCDQLLLECAARTDALLANRTTAAADVKATFAQWIGPLETAIATLRRREAQLLDEVERTVEAEVKGLRDEGDQLEVVRDHVVLAQRSLLGPAGDQAYKQHVQTRVQQLKTIQLGGSFSASPAEADWTVVVDPAPLHLAKAVVESATLLAGTDVGRLAKAHVEQHRQKVHEEQLQLDKQLDDILEHEVAELNLIQERRRNRLARQRLREHYAVQEDPAQQEEQVHVTTAELAPQQRREDDRQAHRQRIEQLRARQEQRRQQRQQQQQQQQQQSQSSWFNPSSWGIIKF